MTIWSFQTTYHHHFDNPNKMHILFPHTCACVHTHNVACVHQNKMHVIDGILPSYSWHLKYLFLVICFVSKIHLREGIKELKEILKLKTKTLDSPHLVYPAHTHSLSPRVPPVMDRVPSLSLFSLSLTSPSPASLDGAPSHWLPSEPLLRLRARPAELPRGGRNRRPPRCPFPLCRGHVTAHLARVPSP